MTPDGQTTVLRFDPEAYPFHRLIGGYIGGGPLAELSAGLPATGIGEGASLYRNMESSPHLRTLYAGLDGEAGAAFYALYRRFLREVIAPQYDGPIYFQRRPSHRILFRDTPGASRFHRDSDYGHVEAEVNYLVPQTRTYRTNAMWLETGVGSDAYAPVELELGEYVRFDGAARRHGAHQNQTGRTRVSFDFRVVPEGLADEDIRTSLARHRDTAGNPVRDNARTFELLEALPAA